MSAQELVDRKPLGRVLRSGWISKQSRGWMRSWQRRWLILTASELLYLYDPVSATSRGRLPLEQVTGARPEELRGQAGLIIATCPGQRDLHVVPEAPPSSGAGERLALAWVRDISRAVEDARAGPGLLPSRSNPLATAGPASPEARRLLSREDPARGPPSSAPGAASERRAADAASLGRSLAACADAVARAHTREDVVGALGDLLGLLRRDAERTGHRLAVARRRSFRRRARGDGGTEKLEDEAEAEAAAQRRCSLEPAALAAARGRLVRAAGELAGARRALGEDPRVRAALRAAYDALDRAAGVPAGSHRRGAGGREGWGGAIQSDFGPAPAVGGLRAAQSFHAGWGRSQRGLLDSPGSSGRGRMAREGPSGMLGDGGPSSTGGSHKGPGGRGSEVHRRGLAGYSSFRLAGSPHAGLGSGAGGGPPQPRRVDRAGGHRGGPGDVPRLPWSSSGSLVSRAHGASGDSGEDYGAVVPVPSGERALLALGFGHSGVGTGIAPSRPLQGRGGASSGLGGSALRFTHGPSVSAAQESKGEAGRGAESGGGRHGAIALPSLQTQAPTASRPASSPSPAPAAAAGPRFEDLFRLGPEIGRGGFSVVHSCTHRRSGRTFAAKLMARKAMAAADRAALLQEVQTQRFLRHPHIVRLVAFFDTDPERYVLVTEMCKGGELFDAIVRREGYSEGEARQVALALLDAVAHCHRLGIVHRDLKPENLLLAEPAGEDGGGAEPAAAIRVADFGFATQLRGRKARAMVGSAGYMAPEILDSGAGKGGGAGGAGGGKGYDKAVDMWSVGVILYVLLCGYMPFEDPKMDRMFAKVRLGTYTFPSAEWSRVSAEAKDLVKRLLVVRPSRRLTAEEALRHPWFELDRGGLDDNHLREAAAQLRRFHARRRLRMLRSALWVKFIMMKRLGLLGGLADKVARDVEAEEEAERTKAAGGGGAAGGELEGAGGGTGRRHRSQTVAVPREGGRGARLLSSREHRRAAGGGGAAGAGAGGGGPGRGPATGPRARGRMQVVQAYQEEGRGGLSRDGAARGRPSVSSSPPMARARATSAAGARGGVGGGMLGWGLERSGAGASSGGGGPRTRSKPDTGPRPRASAAASWRS